MTFIRILDTIIHDIKWYWVDGDAVGMTWDHRESKGEILGLVNLRTRQVEPKTYSIGIRALLDRIRRNGSKDIAICVMLRQDLVQERQNGVKIASGVQEI